MVIPEQEPREIADSQIRFEAIGLTPHEYQSAVLALDTGDTKTLIRLARKSQHELQQREQLFGLSTKEQYYDDEHGEYVPERSDLHEQLVTDALSHGIRQEHPKITFLAGPPGSGKTFYKARFFSREGVVETDPDALKTKLLPGYDGLHPADIAQTHDESLDIAQMILDGAMQKRFSVVCETTLRNLMWLRGVLAKSAIEAYETEVIFLHKPLVMCFTDAFERSERPISLPLILSSVHGYDNLLTLSNDTNVGSIQVYDMSEALTRGPITLATNREALGKSAFQKIVASLQPLRNTL